MTEKYVNGYVIHALQHVGERGRAIAAYHPTHDSSVAKTAVRVADSDVTL